MYSCVYAQDTLYLPVHGLGHEKYVLNDDGTFVYSSHLCGSSYFSFGKFKRNLLGFKFSYDTTRCPKPSLNQLNHGMKSDSTKLTFYSMVDSTRRAFFGLCNIGGQSYWVDSDSIIVSKEKLKTNTLILKEFSDSLTFTFDLTCSELQVYLAPIGLSYDCGSNDIRGLKKRNLGYLHKFEVFDEIKEKPWAKGTKRVVRQYYRLRE